MDKVRVLLLNHEDLRSLLTWDLVWSAVENVFAAEARGEVFVPYKEPLPIETYGMQLAMPGYVRPLQTAGVKWVNYYQNRNGADYPTSWANLLVLNHSDTGLPYAILEATDITNMRTAGGHALIAAKYLAKKSSSVLAVLGSGAQAKAGIAAFDRYFTLSTIKVMSRSKESVERLSHQFEPNLQTKIVSVSSPEELAEGSDLLLTASRANDAPMRSEFIPRGCTVLAVSAFSDLDPAFGRQADKWVLGSLKADGSQIIDSPRFEDRLRHSDVYGTIGQIITGVLPGRENEDERILFTHMGMGPLDIAIGAELYEAARQKGVGTEWTLA